MFNIFPIQASPLVAFICIRSFHFRTVHSTLVYIPTTKRVAIFVFSCLVNYIICPGISTVIKFVLPNGDEVEASIGEDSFAFVFIEVCLRSWLKQFHPHFLPRFLTFRRFIEFICSFFAPSVTGQLPTYIQRPLQIASLRV
jgi:hypothetical protein